MCIYDICGEGIHNIMPSLIDSKNKKCTKCTVYTEHVQGLIRLLNT